MFRRVLTASFQDKILVQLNKIQFGVDGPHLAVNRGAFSSLSKSSLLPQYHKPVSTSQIRQISKKEYQFPELDEKDLKESFTLGSGPGGQSVQTTSNCVRLTHLPTGISVKCHQTRSCEKNRQIARERLRELLDLHYNGESSFQKLQEKERHRKREQKINRSRKKLELKRSFKQREGLE